MKRKPLDMSRYDRKPDVQWKRTDCSGKVVTVQVFVPNNKPRRRSKP